MRKNIMVFIAVASLLFFSYFVSASEEIYFYHNDPFGYPVAKANEREKTGLIFDGSRYYDPEIGRYLKPDRENRNPNPYIPKPDEQMKYNNPILTQSHEIAKTKNKQPWKIFYYPTLSIGLDNLQQSRVLNQNNNRLYIIEILYPKAMFKNNRQKNTDRFSGSYSP